MNMSVRIAWATLRAFIGIVTGAILGLALGLAFVAILVALLSFPHEATRALVALGAFWVLMRMLRRLAPHRAGSHT